MSDKNILLICYEYEGFHSKQTTALVKRPRYLAEYLARLGYQVTVFFSYSREIHHTEQLNSGSLSLISLTYPFRPKVQNAYLQKLRTAWLAFFKGDFSSEWTASALRTINQKGLSFSTAICFFTPRGPLDLGYHLSKKRDLKLIFDFQDPIYEGYPNSLSRTLLDFYYRKIFKRADAVCCVSRQWSEEISRFFPEVTYIPHAIENTVKLPDLTQEDTLVLFYYGSIDFNFQNVGALADFIIWIKAQIPSLKIELKFAGNEETYQDLQRRMNNLVSISFLGWLDKIQLHSEIASTDLLVLLSWEVDERKGIPSKFYEYCRFDKSILILGADAGGFKLEFGNDFADKFVPFKPSDHLSTKNDLKSSLFRPDEDFLNEYAVDHIGEKFVSLIES